ncbi:MAG: 30S ribosomal protein S8 [Planctomycetota bacterium]
MSMTDPVADLFTRMRNAVGARRKHADLPHSGLKERVCRVLEKEGYLREVRVTDVEGRKRLRAYFRLDEDGVPVLQNIERMSKPGRRVYLKASDVPRVLRGMGVGVFSTSRGLLTDRECRDQRLGGEYLVRIW